MIGISVLIATYRRPLLLEQTLRSLAASRTGGLTYELLVVDNAGDAETRRVIANHARRLPLRLLLEPRAGKNRALNLAIREARGDLVVFTDDDVIVDPDWLVEMREGSTRWPDHAVFGGRILPKWPTGAVHPPDHGFLCHAYAIADWRHPEGCYSAGRVFGPNMALRGALCRQGWSFAPDIGPNGTDDYVPGGETDLTIRLERAGFASVYLPRALVFHQVRPEQLRTRWLYKRAFRKGREDIRKKGRPPGPRMCGIPRSLVADACRAYARALLAPAARDAAVAFDRRVHYWRLRGMMHECRRLGRSVAAENHARRVSE